MKYIDVLNNEFGLVLSGGGARGAYEVGVALYLAEVGFQPAVFAGASIGALNSVILASEPTMARGAEALMNLWLELDQKDVLKHTFKEGALLGTGWLSAFLQDPLERLNGRPPVMVSVYRSQGQFLDILRFLAAGAGVGNTAPPDYLCLQDLTLENRMIAVLASAALPGIFSPKLLKDVKDFKDSELVDGGWGDRRELDGNTPFAALARKGCNSAVVVHINDGSLWNRSRFPGAKIIEIRPGKELNPEGEFWSGVNLDPIRIRGWIAQGFEDCARCLVPAVEHMGVEMEMQAANQGRRDALQALRDSSLLG